MDLRFITLTAHISFMTSQINNSIFCSTACAETISKLSHHRSFFRRSQWWPLDSPHKWPARRAVTFHSHDVIMLMAIVMTSSWLPGTSFYQHGLISIPAWISNHMRGSVGWNYWSIPKRQHAPVKLGLDKSFHLTHCDGCDYLSTLLGAKVKPC